ncbi:hypothetical protein H7F15_01535 [Pontibacter sp. Tf4]|uniref:hypothetical protein n=1 Tax=Pontibacter sp. Tf4 TaxID=2761620 RepID=UPI001625314B|nr:hypothetical protein [Pontibacter sp. Tf4]MBB6609707.1 hypothetical protein [Pontibacter sp. Tf4]
MKLNKQSTKAGRNVRNLAGRDISILTGNNNMAFNKIRGNHNIQAAGTVIINYNFNKKHLQFLESLIERLYNEKECLQTENKELKAQLQKLQFEVKQQLQTARDVSGQTAYNADLSAQLLST